MEEMTGSWAVFAGEQGRSTMRTGVFVLVSVPLLLCACTRVVVTKDPSFANKGIRFYRPKPYLFIGELAAPSKELTKNCDSTGAGPTTVKVAIQLAHLPDYNEEYAIELRPGMGIGELEIKLEDGWNLTSVGMKTDQQVDELATAGGSLIGALRRPADARDPQQIVAEATRNVPLGFYEPVVGCDEHGRRHLIGWRYVGFLPFAACPVEVNVCSNTVACDGADIWALVNTPNGLRFQKLADVVNGALERRLLSDEN
jgi:hypothetical protein